MTTETYTLPPVATVSSVGPYAIPHEYHAAEEISVTVTTGGATVTLIQGAEYTVSPDADASAGAVTLTATAAALHAGAALRIIRRTVIEQGYAAQGGEREAGLEVQLDRITRGVQDIARDIGGAIDSAARALRVPDDEAALASLPAAASRADRLLGFDAAGLPLMYSPAFALTVAAEGMPTFASAAAAALVDVPAEVDAIRLLGRYSPGDRSAGLMFRAASMPSHLMRVQTGDGQWWQSVEDEPTPLSFGARWDSVTDDTAAINAWASHLRATGKSGRFPPGTAYCAGTLYLGDVRIRGAGGPTRADAFTSKTVIRSDGNPRLSMSPNATTATNFFGTYWEGFTVIDGGGAFAPIELWDRLSYPYKIGIWIGRNHNFMQRTTDAVPEAINVGGAGGLTMRNVTVDDANGWGIYAYKLQGKSLVDDCFVRRCGGRAAYELGDDRLGGAMFISGASVDFRVRDLHAFNSGYADPLHNSRGCGVRLGGDKAVVEAAGLNRLWDIGGNQIFDGLQLERFRKPIIIDASTHYHFGPGVVSGDPTDNGTLHVGWGPNPVANVQGAFDKLKCFNIDRIDVTHPGSDLGGIVNRDSSTAMEIHSWAGTSWSATGADSWGAGRTGQTTTLIPRADADAMPGGKGTRSAYLLLPYFATRYNPGAENANLLPPFAAGPGPLAGWVHDGIGTGAAGSAFAGTTRDGATIYYDVTDSGLRLAPGDRLTLQIWAELVGANVWQDIEFGVADLLGADLIRRDVDFGSGVSGEIQQRAIQVIVPEVTDGGGLHGVRVFFKSTTANVVRWRHPILAWGDVPSLGQRPLTVWHSATGPIVCT